MNVFCYDGKYLLPSQKCIEVFTSFPEPHVLLPHFAPHFAFKQSSFFKNTKTYFLLYKPVYCICIKHVHLLLNIGYIWILAKAL